MRNPVKKFFNQYFYFSKSDRNAIIILSVLILISVIANIIVKKIQPESKYDYAKFKKMVDEWNVNDEKASTDEKYLFMFNPNTVSKEEFDSLNIPSFIKQNILSYRDAGGSFSSSEQLRKIYGMNDSIFSAIEPYIDIPEILHVPEKIIDSEKITFDKSGFFDPNTADVETLAQYGFNNFQTENLVKYREKGGVFNQKGDLLRIYGIDSLFFSSIENNIQIENIPENNSVEKPFIIVELNSADSTELMKLDGIGPTFANRILKYRDLLGGFYSKSQLMEVYNFPSETYINIVEHIKIDTLKLKKIRINYVDFSELVKHPYLNRNTVNSILKFREKNGAFRDVTQIKSVELIDSITYSQIRPYITCR